MIPDMAVTMIRMMSPNMMFMNAPAAMIIKRCQAGLSYRGSPSAALSAGVSLAMAPLPASSSPSMAT